MNIIQSSPPLRRAYTFDLTEPEAQALAAMAHAWTVDAGREAPGVNNDQRAVFAAEAMKQLAAVLEKA